jgi:hypothetical protein
VGNNPINYVDPTGHEAEEATSRIIALGCPTCVAGAGHVATIVVTNGKATYYSFAPAGDDSGPLPTKGQLTEIPIPDVDVNDTAALVAWINKNERVAKNAGQYTQGKEYMITASAAEKAISKAKSFEGDWYFVGTHNCLDLASDSLKAAGIVSPQGSRWNLFTSVPILPLMSQTPNLWMRALQGQEGGYVLNLEPVQ